MNSDRTTIASSPGKSLLSELHHVGITVSDIERSIHFYRDVLGLLLVRRRSTTPITSVSRRAIREYGSRRPRSRSRPTARNHWKWSSMRRTPAGQAIRPRIWPATRIFVSASTTSRRSTIRSSPRACASLAAGGRDVGSQPRGLRRLFLRPRWLHARTIPAAAGRVIFDWAHTWDDEEGLPRRTRRTRSKENERRK